MTARDSSAVCYGLSCQQTLGHHKTSAEYLGRDAHPNPKSKLWMRDKKKAIQVFRLKMKNSTSANRKYIYFGTEIKFLPFDSPIPFEISMSSDTSFFL